MALPDIFTKEVSEGIIDRINKLDNATAAKWGKMNVGQMLAHCSVTYEYIFDEAKYPKPKGMRKFLLKAFVKGIVTNEKGYKPGSPTAPDFIITDQRDFEREKSKLVDYIRETQSLGGSHFDGKQSHSFGVLNKTEWNNMFYKHLNHHLTQFGV